MAEDAAWLRKKDDYGHINIAELEAVVRGVNLALKWGLREIEVVTDSATVCGWVRLMLSEEKRIKTKGAAEILVKRRIGVLKELIDDLQLALTITLVPSERNKADVLTRVKSWLSTGKDGEEDGICAGAVSLREMHHLGVDRSLYLARKVDPAVTRQSVQRVVKGCEQCQRIDPAPAVHEGEEIWVTGNWRRWNMRTRRLSEQRQSAVTRTEEEGHLGGWRTIRPTQILMSNCPSPSLPYHILGRRGRVIFLSFEGGGGGMHS